MVVKLRDELRGEHVHMRVFCGEDEDHLALAGELVFNVGEWQEFGAALILGARKMHGNIKVLNPDEQAMCDAFMARAKKEKKLNG